MEAENDATCHIENHRDPRPATGKSIDVIGDDEIDWSMVGLYNAKGLTSPRNSRSTSSRRLPALNPRLRVRNAKSDGSTRYRATIRRIVRVEHPASSAAASTSVRSATLAIRSLRFAVAHSAFGIASNSRSDVFTAAVFTPRPPVLRLFRHSRQIVVSAGYKRE